MPLAFISIHPKIEIIKEILVVISDNYYYGREKCLLLLVRLSSLPVHVAETTALVTLRRRRSCKVVLVTRCVGLRLVKTRLSSPMYMYILFPFSFC